MNKNYINKRTWNIFNPLFQRLNGLAKVISLKQWVAIALIFMEKDKYIWNYYKLYVGIICYTFRILASLSFKS